MTTAEARVQPLGEATAALGAHYDGGGTYFALHSSLARRVELCLFDDELETRVPLQQADGGVWEGYLHHLSPGQPYGYRVHGPWDPAHGARCNPAKLLLDPYARAVARRVHRHPAIFGHMASDPDRPDPVDSAPYVPRSIVVAPEQDRGDDQSPGHSMADSVFYELHVGRFTRRHPDVPDALRGTYAALAEPAVIDHLRCLGVTAVELLPVQQSMPDLTRSGRHLRDDRGHRPIGCFAPHNAYSSSGERGQQVAEFRRMVRAFHAADLEVILAVVFDHTAEGDHNGPTLCLRGIDNPGYYQLADDRSRYVDDTGCGNTVDLYQPAALRMVMDALRYWVQEMHVDGFRFDRTVDRARLGGAFDPWSSFLHAIRQDPVLSTIKLIAEPRGRGRSGQGARGGAPAPARPAEREGGPHRPLVGAGIKPHIT